MELTEFKEWCNPRRRINVGQEAVGQEHGAIGLVSVAGVAVRRRRHLVEDLRVQAEVLVERRRRTLRDPRARKEVSGELEKVRRVIVEEGW